MRSVCDKPSYKGPLKIKIKIKIKKRQTMAIGNSLQLLLC